MKIYIASSWKMENVCKYAAGFIRDFGHEVDLFCEKSDNRVSFSFNDIAKISKEGLAYNGISIFNETIVQEAFDEDKKWLDWCDAVLLILPSGRSAHLEAGYAKGKGKKLFIVGDFLAGELDLMYGFADAMYKWEDWEKLLHFIKNPITNVDNKQLEFLLSGTNYQVLKALVPDIDKHIKENPKVMDEIIERSRKLEHGFRPFEWLMGMD